MSKKTWYFSHDADARNDTKIIAMRSAYGFEGYGWYWVLIEKMRTEENYAIAYKNYTWVALAEELKIDIEKIKKFVNDCIYEFELFIEDEKGFWAESLRERMNEMNEVNEKRKGSANARWSKKTDANAMQTDANAMQTDANAMQTDANAMQDYLKIKENKIKENKIKEEEYPPPPTGGDTSPLDPIFLDSEKKKKKYSEDFEIIFKAYPHPTHTPDKQKSRCLKNFNGRLKEHGIEKINAFIQAYINCHKDNDYRKTLANVLSKDFFSETWETMQKGEYQHPQAPQQAKKLNPFQQMRENMENNFPPIKIINPKKEIAHGL